MVDFNATIALVVTMETVSPTQGTVMPPIAARWLGVLQRPNAAGNDSHTYMIARLIVCRGSCVC